MYTLNCIWQHARCVKLEFNDVSVAAPEFCTIPLSNTNVTVARKQAEAASFSKFPFFSFLDMEQLKAINYSMETSSRKETQSKANRGHCYYVRGTLSTNQGKIHLTLKH